MVAAERPLRSDTLGAARDLLWPRPDVEVLLPVIAGSVERVVHVIPRDAPGFLEKDAYVAALVDGQRPPTEMLGRGSEQCIGAPARVGDVNDDRGEWHRLRS
jgi:hypothetical protein